MSLAPPSTAEVRVPGWQAALDLLAATEISLGEKAYSLRGTNAPNVDVTKELRDVRASVALLTADSSLKPSIASHATQAVTWLETADAASSEPESRTARMDHGDGVYNAHEQVMLARRTLDPSRD